MEDLFIPYDCETAKGRTRGEKKTGQRSQRSKVKGASRIMKTEDTNRLQLSGR